MDGPAPKLSVIKNKKRQQLRTTNGAYLFELLVSLLISGFLTAMLAQSLSEVIRINTKTDRSLIAATIAQDLIDRVRAIPYDELDALDVAETYTQINFPETSSNPPSSSSLLARRPLQIDVTNLKWGHNLSTLELPKYAFRGTAKISIAQTSMDIDAKSVTVHIEWVDSSSISKPHVYETGTVISRYGLARHNE